MSPASSDRSDVFAHLQLSLGPFVPCLFSAVPRTKRDKLNLSDLSQSLHLLSYLQFLKLSLDNIEPYIKDIRPPNTQLYHLAK